MEVKFIVKEVYRHTAACDACKVRKRKCDGVAPCKYCVSKNIKCEFSQQKKRGPSKKVKPEGGATSANKASSTTTTTTVITDNKAALHQALSETLQQQNNKNNGGVIVHNNNNHPVSAITTVTNDSNANLATVALQVARESLATSVIDKEMLNTLELNHYIDLYTRFVTNVVPACNVESLISPSSVAHKLQSYAAMAFAARSIGDYTKAKLFISQGRVLAGSLFDSPDLDTVVGMVMMGNYWQMSLNLPLSGHYANLAWSLFKLLRRPDYRVQLCCQVNFIMSDLMTNDESKRDILSNAARAMRAKGNASDNLAGTLLSLSAKVIPIFGSSIYFPYNLPNIFQVFKEIFITEEERASIMDDLNQLEKIMVRQTFYISAKDAVHPFLLQVKLYQTIVEWKSGHADIAYSHALQAWEICKKMQSAKILGVTCDFPHLCLLAGLADFFYEQAQMGQALHACNLLRQICNLMGPDYDFVSECIEEFTRVNAINDYEVNQSDNESLGSENSPHGSPFHPGIIDSPNPMATPIDPYASYNHSPITSNDNSPSVSTNALNSYDVNNCTTTTTTINNTMADGIVFDANELLRFEDDLTFISNGLESNSINTATNTTTSLPSNYSNFNQTTTSTTNMTPNYANNFQQFNTTAPLPLNTPNTTAINTSTTFSNPLEDPAVGAAIDAIITESLNNYPNNSVASPSTFLTSSSSFITPPPMDNTNTPATNNDISNNFTNNTDINNNTNNVNTDNNLNNNITNTTNTINPNPNNQLEFDFGALGDSGNFFEPPELWDFSNIPPATPKGS